MNEEKKRPEGIRAWYDRTTSKARTFLLWLSVVGTTTAIVVFFFVPEAITTRIQQFNGALTIPLFGLIWILGFIYLFLNPQREAAFRGQEWIEEMVTLLHKSMDEKIAPTVKLWGEIGEQIKKEIPGLISGAKETMNELRAAAKDLTDAVKRNEKVVEDLKPAIDALKRIETKIEVEIKRGMFEKLDSALESVGGLPKTDVEEPNSNWALESIRRNKAKAAGGKA